MAIRFSNKKFLYFPILLYSLCLVNHPPPQKKELDVWMSFLSTSPIWKNNLEKWFFKPFFKCLFFKWKLVWTMCVTLHALTQLF